MKEQQIKEYSLLILGPHQLHLQSYSFISCCLKSARSKIEKKNNSWKECMIEMNSNLLSLFTIRLWILWLNSSSMIGWWFYLLPQYPRVDHHVHHPTLNHVLAFYLSFLDFHLFIGSMSEKAIQARANPKIRPNEWWRWKERESNQGIKQRSLPSYPFLSFQISSVEPLFTLKSS